MKLTGKLFARSIQKMSKVAKLKRTTLHENVVIRRSYDKEILARRGRECGKFEKIIQTLITLTKERRRFNVRTTRQAFGKTTTDGRRKYRCTQPRPDSIKTFFITVIRILSYGWTLSGKCWRNTFTTPHTHRVQAVRRTLRVLHGLLLRLGRVRCPARSNLSSAGVRTSTWFRGEHPNKSWLQPENERRYESEYTSYINTYTHYTNALRHLGFPMFPGQGGLEGMPDNPNELYQLPPHYPTPYNQLITTAAPLLEWNTSTTAQKAMLPFHILPFQLQIEIQNTYFFDSIAISCSKQLMQNQPFFLFLTNGSRC